MRLMHMMAAGVLSLVGLPALAATTYTIAIDGPAAGSLVSGDFSGTFDATALGIDLASISNATFSVSFVDNAGDPSTTVWGTTSLAGHNNYGDSGFVYSGGNAYTYRDVNYTVTNVTTTQGESFVVSLDGGGADAAGSTAGSTSSSAVRTSTGQTNDGYVTGYGCPDTCRVIKFYDISNDYLTTTTTVVDHTGAMGGSFAVAATDPTAFASFLVTGRLDVGFAMIGDALFEGATLTFDADLPQAPPSAVPEPASLALVLAGLGLFATRRGRRAGA